MSRQRFIVSLVLVLNIGALSASLQEALIKYRTSLTTLKSSLLQGKLVQFSPRGCDGSNGGDGKKGEGSGND